MTITRNTGADLIPFHAARPSYPGARLRAMRDAQARRERENAQQSFDADRLARDLDARPPDVRVNDGDDPEKPATREYLRNMGWNDQRYDRAAADRRDDLRRRVHPQVAATVTAGGTPSALSPEAPHPPAVISSRAALVMQHATNALAAGTDPRVVQYWQQKQLAWIVRGAR